MLERLSNLAHIIIPEYLVKSFICGHAAFITYILVTGNYCMRSGAIVMHNHV